VDEQARRLVDDDDVVVNEQNVDLFQRVAQ
jgi:hypothetical protein